jgi:hypothetical protein
VLIAGQHPKPANERADDLAAKIAMAFAKDREDPFQVDDASRKERPKDVHFENRAAPIIAVRLGAKRVLRSARALATR